MRHLGRVLGFGCVLAIVAAFAAPPEVVAQKKKNAKAVADNGYGATPEDYKAILNRKELTGSIVTVSGTVVTFRTDSPHIEANPKYKAGNTPQAAQQNRQYQESLRLQRDLVQAQNAKNPTERARAMQRYYQDMARYQQTMQQQAAQLQAKAAKDRNYVKNNANNTTDPFILVHSYKEFDLEIRDNAVIRKMFLPFEYDDMGNVKTYTDKQKADLRGDDKSKPGYMSKVDEIVAGMEAKLSLTAPPKKKKDPDAKPDEEGAGMADRPTVNAILLTKDAPGAMAGADDRKKKKK